MLHILIHMEKLPINEIIKIGPKPKDNERTTFTESTNCFLLYRNLQQAEKLLKSAPKSDL